jgi:hypothetical protein
MKPLCENDKIESARNKTARNTLERFSGLLPLVFANKAGLWCEKSRIQAYSMEKTREQIFAHLNVYFGCFHSRQIICGGS